MEYFYVGKAVLVGWLHRRTSRNLSHFLGRNTEDAFRGVVEFLGAGHVVGSNLLAQIGELPYGVCGRQLLVRKVRQEDVIGEPRGNVKLAATYSGAEQFQHLLE